jgi:REP element-mobilizing transposase RayT
VFGLDVCAYSVMSNHIHVVLRVRPVVVRRWSDEEIAERWLTLFPRRVTPQREGPLDAEALRKAALAEILADDGRVQELRARLGSVSWFMRCLNEPIARRANREDDCTGRFWEGRFKCQRLLDDAAVLACMAYVDLNPVRAKVAQTPETSEFTSVRARISARQAREKQRQLEAKKLRTKRQEQMLDQVKRQLYADRHLAPLAGGGRFESDGRYPAPSCLPMSVDEYLALIDWTGRQLKQGKRGRIPPKLEPVLQRLDLDATQWVQTIDRYGSLFWQMVGRAESLLDAARRLGRRWIKGIRNSHEAFAPLSAPPD